MLTSSDIFFELISSTLVLDLYGLMWRILYLIFVIYRSIGKKMCYHKRAHIWCFIFVCSFLVIMTLSPTLYLWPTQFLFSRILSLLFSVCFR